MSWIRTLKGGRPWFGKREAKAAGRVSRRQEDRCPCYVSNDWDMTCPLHGETTEWFINFPEYRTGMDVDDYIDRVDKYTKGHPGF